MVARQGEHQIEITNPANEVHTPDDGCINGLQHESSNPHGNIGVPELEGTRLRKLEHDAMQGK